MSGAGSYAPTIAALGALVLGILTFVGGELKDRRNDRRLEREDEWRRKYEEEVEAHRVTKRKLAAANRRHAKVEERE